MAKKERVIEKEEMSIEEARALRASRHVACERTFSEQEKREFFRLFWAKERHKYGKEKDLEQIIWLHLKSSKLDDPEKFESGLAHFGLVKV
jgi:hypothetical protein